MDMSQVVEYGQSMTFLGSIGGLALALLGAGLAAVLTVEFYAILSLLASMLMIINISA